MATQTLYANQSAKISKNDENFNDHVTDVIDFYLGGQMLVDFELSGATNRFNVIDNIDLYLYKKAGGDSTTYIYCYPLGAKFDETTVTAKTRPGNYSGVSHQYNLGTYDPARYLEFKSAAKDGIAARYLVQNGAWITGGQIEVITSHGINKMCDEGKGETVC